MKVGRFSALSVFFLLLAYIVVTSLGFISLKSPLDPIADPYFTIMEILIIIIAPMMLIVMIVVDSYATEEVKIFSKIALVFMVIMATITSSVHFTILTFSHQNVVTKLSWTPLFFSFKWPSVAYALDILAWDWFFALSFIFASRVFRNSNYEKTVSVLMIIAAVLSLIGLLGVPLGNMQIRDIGIIGYALVSPIVFLMLSKIFYLNQRMK
jgi:hypothetical protein